jgi:hypothetical protein
MARFEQADPGGEEDERDRRRLHRRQGIGVRVEPALRDHHVMPVPAVMEDRDGPVSFPPGVHVGADLCYPTRNLEAGAERPWREGLVDAGTHQEVGEVDPGSLDIEPNLAGPRGRERDLLLGQDLGASVALDQNCAGRRGGHGSLRAASSLGSMSFSIQQLIVPGHHRVLIVAVQ